MSKRYEGHTQHPMLAGDIECGTIIDKEYGHVRYRIKPFAYRIDESEPWPALLATRDFLSRIGGPK